MNSPYFYKIRNKKSGMYYVGSQYAKKCNRNNFFKSYFTSSNIIKKIVNEEGIDSFEIITLTERHDAREYEARYLQKAYALLGKEKFLSTFYNRNISPGILLDTAIIEKQTNTKKMRWSRGEISKPIPPNWKGKCRSATMKQKLSESKKGHLVSDETRKKLRDSNLGKSQSKQTIQKRLDALASNENAFNKKHWLCVSPEKKFHYIIGKRNVQMKNLGLVLGLNFYNFLNSNQSPTTGKNKGWLFFEGKDKINELLKNIDKSDIIYYE